MLIQLQHQDIESGERDFIAQTDLPDDGTFCKRYNEWVTDVRNRHPLPDGKWWCCYTEHAAEFFMTAVPKDAT